MIATANLARQLETIEEVKLGPSIVGTFIHNGHNDAVQSLLDLSFHYLHHGQKYHGEQDRPNFKIGADYDTVLQGLLADHDEVEVNKLLASIVAVLRTIIKNRAKVSDVRSSLSAIGFQDAFTEAIVQKLMTSRRELEYSAVVNGFHFNRLEKLRWRVDVTISCSALAKVMRPNILFQMVLKDGSIRTFEVSVEQFNQLRYNVAKAVSEIQRLQRHPMMKIVNEFTKREEDDCNK